jgi:hypothetical protein
LEIDVLFQHHPQQILPLRRIAVRAESRSATGILEEPVRPEKPIVQKFVLKRAGGFVPPERI